MQVYTPSLYSYRRLTTRVVKIGHLLLGGGHPIRIQTMTTTDTMDTMATVEQSIRCIEAGAEMVRITAPSKKEAENLQLIKDELRKRGYTTPLIADIHFTPNAAEIAARIVEKVRVNPGNYVDKKKFEQIDYTDAEYAEEIERIRERFTPLVKICREYGTAMRIGTNHGSLSDRIMSRYGDTAMGMVESAMEFLRIARSEDYHNIILSMKSSNPLVMVQAYRLLVYHMMEEFGECYPLHLGVTEAGDGEDGRIKSAIGIGSLLEDGIGDTIRVSLTEDPELEIPVCKDIVNRYNQSTASVSTIAADSTIKLPYNPFEYKRRQTKEVNNLGGKQVPVVIADFSKSTVLQPQDLSTIGYQYDSINDKWHIGDAAADYLFANNEIEFALPGSLKIILPYQTWLTSHDKEKCFPIMDAAKYLEANPLSHAVNFIMLDCFSKNNSAENITELFAAVEKDPTAVLCLSSTNKNALQSIRRMFVTLMENNITAPTIIICDSKDETIDQSLIHYAIETGGLLLDGFSDGLCFGLHYEDHSFAAQPKILNSIAFGILQATRSRISKTEYISCPSCGRTLFDLQETTAKIRAVTNHLKGVKIAIMGCIVNGPGEMADADFGYVGSGVGKITLYKGKEIVKRNIDSNIAVDELINLLKENSAWVNPTIH
ncbi:MAG: (E)-4-hydroxy-3-methylbut-2-enyl-diphosphate synthase [Chitinophagaceae bacterium]